MSPSLSETSLCMTLQTHRGHLADSRLCDTDHLQRETSSIID